MFEDILGEEEEKLKLSTSNTTVCPYCGSDSIEEDGIGTFTSNTTFVQPQYCNKCSNNWEIVYNENLEIVSIIY